MFFTPIKFRGFTICKTYQDGKYRVANEFHISVAWDGYKYYDTITEAMAVIMGYNMKRRRINNV